MGTGETLGTVGLLFPSRILKAREVPVEDLGGTGSPTWKRPPGGRPAGRMELARSAGRDSV